MAFTVATATSRAQSTRTSWRTWKLRRQKRTKLRRRKLQKLRNLQPDLQLKDVRSISSGRSHDQVGPKAAIGYLSYSKIIFKSGFVV
jgi:hypothetical protein